MPAGLRRRRGHRRGRRARLESQRRLRSSRRTGDRPRLERRGRRDRLDRHADAGDDAPQIGELGLAAGTRRQMRLERPGLGRIERVDGVRRDGVFEFLVRRRSRERSPQRHHRGSDARLDGAERDARPGRDFRVRQAFVIREIDERALLVGKFLEGGAHVLRVLGRNGDLLRTPTARRERQHGDRIDRADPESGRARRARSRSMARVRVRSTIQPATLARAAS